MTPHGEYFQLATKETITVAYNVIEDQNDAPLYAAELTYYELHHAVPEWAVILERVIEEPEGDIFICQDYRRRM